MKNKVDLVTYIAFGFIATLTVAVWFFILRWLFSN